VTYTRCCIDTINSPDDGHMVARNMYRIEINIHEKELCVKLVIYKDYTEMHDQQNINFELFPLHVCYMLQSVLIPSSGMLIQKPNKGGYNKNLWGLSFTVTVLYKIRT
jgi:hypothetical protein